MLDKYNTLYDPNVYKDLTNKKEEIQEELNQIEPDKKKLQELYWEQTVRAMKLGNSLINRYKTF